MLLAEIEVLETVGVPSSVVARDVEVRGIEHDSRRVRPGDLFCCLPGALSDGHDHAPEAVARGAVGLVGERFVELPAAPAAQVPQVVVAPGTVRRAMAQLASAFYGHPSRQLLMAGVTGTNGKTTVTHLLGTILAEAGRSTEVIGTLSGIRTTPEAPELQARLAAVRDRGATAVAMEVSSHALVQSRVDGIRFDVAVFTNLSHDHLDFHGSMEAYFGAKASLFEPERAALGVIDVDDQWGARLADQVAIPVVPVRRADAEPVDLEPGRSAFAWRGHQVQLALTGLVNVENALLAAEAAAAMGVAEPEVVAGLAAASPVPGRLEVVADAGFSVLVDYAHTPNGLEVALAEARRLAGSDRRVLVAFGCGGDRDRAKRPLMAAAAVGGSDLAVLTSDNPRSEDPLAIIEEVRAGIPPAAMAAGRVVIEPDRRRAIVRVLEEASAGDVVVVAGKGHEQYQEIGDTRVPFDDRAIVKQLLAQRGSAQ